MTFCVPDESASCEESEEEDTDAVNSLNRRLYKKVPIQF